MVGFKLPGEVEDNTDGWGPISVPPQFESVPFMPFGKGDRLGKIADFGGTSGRSQHYQNRYREPAPGTSIFNFEKVEEDEQFELVDNKPVKKPTGNIQRRPQYQQQGQQGQQGQQQRWGQQGGRGDQQGGRQGQHGQGGGRGNQGGPGGFRTPWRDQQRAQYTASIDVRPEWHVLGDQIALSALHKLSTKAGTGEELATLGSLSAYDRAADRVTPKLSAKLRRAGSRAHATSVLDDPIMQQYVNGNVGDVFMTDAILTVLMTAPRSVYPWDIVIIKKGDKLFFDRRPGSSLEYVTNGETAPDPIAEDSDNINGMQQLSAEATGINQAFREQVLSSSTGGTAHVFGDPLPPQLASGGTPPPGYKYTKWTLGSTTLVIRSEFDAYLRAGDAVQTVAVHALNEFDPKWSGVDWRQKLENQRGAVLATELKNNAAKIARWTAAALVGGIDIIKLGYVSRVSFRDGAQHVLLGTQTVKPRDFAAQMNLNMENAWGIVRAMVDLCYERIEDDGKYLLVRDPNKPQMMLYALPADGMDNGIDVPSDEDEVDDDDDADNDRE